MLDIDATRISKIVNISLQTINKIIKDFREIIATDCERNSLFDTGEIELYESYFGARRVKGKRGRRASGKVPVFGMLKRNDNVYTHIINNCSVTELFPVIGAQASKDSTIYTE